ncbi:MAG: helix-turn-helix domain-containing protein [Anaerolineae bacterium]|nr:helix-turn-helix domain-containing protein [Anaerolineae bacterium]
MSKNPTPETLTVAQVAVYLRLHPLTVRAMARKGDLPVFKVGRQWRAKCDQRGAWIKRQCLENVNRSGD